MMTLSLISEEIYRKPLLEAGVVTEGSKKRLYIEGVFAQSEIRNRNGRVYPRTIMEKAVSKYVSEKVSAKQSLGELNHPPRLSVLPEEAAIFIKELKFDGDDVVGKAVVLEDLPKGKIVKGLIESGVQLGVSTRGAGKVVEREGASFVDHFVLSAIDVVTEPSAPQAYVRGIHESLAIIEDNGILTEANLDNLYKEVKAGDVSPEVLVQKILTIMEDR